jgi:magnesium transporter
MASDRRGKAARRRRRRRRRRVPPGTSPGTLVLDPEAPRPSIMMISYGPEGFSEKPIARPAEIQAQMAQHPIHWINVDGLGDEVTLRELGEIFRLHRLALEDVVNTHQRAKIEHYPDHLYIVAHEVHTGDGVSTEQVSIFVGSNYVLTFQEQAGDLFDPVRARIRDGRGRMRQAGTGYLAYALLDAIVDFYFPVLEGCGEQLERLEDEVLNRPRRRTVARIHAIKRELLLLRRSAWPMRDVLHGLLRDETPLIQTEDRYYLQDCYDHTMRVLEMIESFREVSSSLLDVYLSSQGNRMNEIMKVLTMFASIFIPLSFIASLYGMNFDTSLPWNMPELAWPYGYFFALGLMSLVAAVLVGFFVRKGWLGPGERDDVSDDAAGPGEPPGPPAPPGPDAPPGPV